MEFVAKPAQSKIVDFMMSHRKGLVIAGLGLGKTAASLAALDALFIDGDITKALILAPKRVARTVWPAELQQWDEFRWLDFEMVHGRTAAEVGKAMMKARIVIANYESLPKLTQAIRIHGMRFSSCIYDESTFLKNASGKRIKEARGWLKLIKRRWGLTGNPIPNDLFEIFGQMLAIDDGASLGKHATKFRTAFFEKQTWNKYGWDARPFAEDQVRQLIAPHCIRLSTEEYGDAPPMREEDVELTMPSDVAKIYRKLATDYLLDKDLIAQSAAILTMKLVQLTGGSVYENSIAISEDVSITGEPRDIHDLKIQALKKLTTKGNALVLHAFRRERERILESLPGSVPFSEDRIDDWNAGRIRYFVANPKSMSHGLNLQFGGHELIWYSLPHSRDAFDQTNGRICRSGQKHETIVYRLIIENTVDEAIAELLRNRFMTSQQFLERLQKQCRIN